jgi:elongation factor Ts
MAFSAELIKKLREETGAPVVRVKKLLDEMNNDEKKVREILMKEGFEKMEKRSDRETSEGRVVAYTHHTGKVAAMVELLCETDFVGRNELFMELAKSIALQIVSMNPSDRDELLGQEFIKDTSKTIEELIKEVTSKTGEVIRLGRFVRMEIGK